MRPLRVMRVIPRMGMDGPALQVGTLMCGMDSTQFDQRLYAGRRAESDRRRAPAVRVYPVTALGRSTWPTDSVRALAALVAEIRDFRPDIVHTHTARAGALGRIASAIHGVPIRVHTFHGYLPEPYLSRQSSSRQSLSRQSLSSARTRLLIGAERALARRNDTLIAASAGIRDQLLAAGIGRPGQFELMPPGVGLGPLPRRADARRTFGLTGRGPVVAFVGGITRARRPDRMLAVARRVQSAVPDVQFVVYGEGDQLTATVNGAATHRLNMSFLGWRTDIETVYAAADLVLLTSDHEDVPVEVIEAGLAARPVVATDVGGVADVVRHGETGLLAERDIDSLCHGVERLLRDDALRRRMGQAAKAEATRRFDPDRLIADTTELYRRLAVRRGRWPGAATAAPPAQRVQEAGATTESVG